MGNQNWIENYKKCEINKEDIHTGELDLRDQLTKTVDIQRLMIIFLTTMSQTQVKSPSVCTS